PAVPRCRQINQLIQDVELYTPRLRRFLSERLLLFAQKAPLWAARHKKSLPAPASGSGCRPGHSVVGSPPAVLQVSNFTSGSCHLLGSVLKTARGGFVLLFLEAPHFQKDGPAHQRAGGRDRAERLLQDGASKVSGVSFGEVLVTVAGDPAQTQDHPAML
ncbi:MAG TPA: hypothetical protein VLL97_08810, partial [Acidobacteriota bacterium]|nr:hypothetical protein [Acidobacteriota bacterium]